MQNLLLFVFLCPEKVGSDSNDMLKHAEIDFLNSKLVESCHHFRVIPEVIMSHMTSETFFKSDVVFISSALNDADWLRRLHAFFIRFGIDSYS